MSFLFLIILTACAQQELTLEDKIRKYIFANPTMSGEQFVDWAEKELKGNSAQTIFRAIHNVGEAQAERGHPNAIAVLSTAALAWANEKGLRYNVRDWQDMQDQAITNLRSGPSQIEFWPSR
jgi:hypothetical protein